jgi:hypothetical protein
MTHSDPLSMMLDDRMRQDDVAVGRAVMLVACRHVRVLWRTGRLRSLR